MVICFATARPNRAINVGRMIDETLAQIGMSHKEAAILCEVDSAQWSRAIHGLSGYSLDLWKLANGMPWRFWAVFGYRLLSAIARRTVDEIGSEAEEFRKRA